MSVQHKSLFDTPLTRLPFRDSVTEGILPGRNWHFDETAGWSRDVDCSLLVLATQFPEPVALILEFCVFGATPETPRTIVIESPGHPPVRHKVTTGGSQWLLVQSPVFAEVAQTAEIVLRLDRVESPFRLDQSEDDRLLGLMILSLQPFKAEFLFPLDFTNPAVASRYLVSGWSTPEAHGIWSVDSRAVILLPGWLRGTARALRFGAITLPRPETVEPMTVTITCNGQVMLERTCLSDPPEPWICPLDQTWPEGEALEIEFHFKDLRAPVELGINADRRTLGILLHSLTVAADETSGRSDPPSAP